MSLINPYFYNRIKEYMSKGYNLETLLDEYNDGIFVDYIKANYYHLNKGPDLRDYQIEAINDAEKVFFEKNVDNYKLFWCCGLGKTKTAITISYRLNFKTILIGFPSILLLEQFYEDLIHFYPVYTIFKFYSKESNNKSLNKDLETHILSNKRYKIILTTYHSSKHILNVVNKHKFVFDFVILDEAHHLHSKNSKNFSCILDIPFKKRLLLTATPYMGNETNTLLSLEKSPGFKGHSNTKSVPWAIKNNYIVDYNIIILKIDYLDLNIEEFSNLGNKDMVLAAFMALKCIYNNKSKKMLIYCNKIKNAKQIQEIITTLLSKYKNDTKLFNNNNINLDIGNYELNGTDTHDQRIKIINHFKKKEYGIMSSVQLFGEGYDYPGLDSVLFAENMDSPIRIVQSALRPCRKDKYNPNKKANILLPILDNNYSKLKHILSKMNSVDYIYNKIQIYDNNTFNSALTNKEETYNKLNLSPENKIFLEKIELEYFSDLRFKEIKNYDFISSKIVACHISNKENHIISDNKIQFNKILIDIWKTIDRDILINISTFKFKTTDEQGTKGFNWCEPINLSFQSNNANGSMREILHIVKSKNYKLRMSIKLKNSEIANINI